MLLLAVKEKRQWLVSLICRYPAHSSGACHRSRQLLEILEGSGWSLLHVADPAPPSSRLATIWAGLRAAAGCGPLQPCGVDSLRSQGHGALTVEELLRRYPNLKGVILEGTGYGSLASVGLWKAKGLRTVLVPANIESLAPNIGSWTHRGLDVSQRFAHERRWWRLADAVFTISIEEAWWLQLHGIAAEHLPYYPEPQREEHLLAMRAQRQPEPAVGWLWLADFRNPANRAGVPLTLEWLERCADPPLQLQIVGRGSDWLQQAYGSQLPSYSRVRGELGDQELEQLYRHCTAQLLVHPATSGMPTRVVDAALAGISVVGNAMATKSYWFCFDDQAMVVPPCRPRKAEARFLLQLAC